MKTVKLTKLEIDVIENQLMLNASQYSCKAKELGIYPRKNCDSCKYRDIIDSILEKIGEL